jgi:hypothetical protein
MPRAYANEKVEGTNQSEYCGDSSQWAFWRTGIISVCPKRAIEACGTVAQDVPTVEQQSQLVAHL